MRRPDGGSAPEPGPEMSAGLQAIDATLAGEPVDPVHAELAELCLILRDERPTLDPAAAARLDARAAGRFAGSPRAPRRAAAASDARSRWWRIGGAAAANDARSRWWRVGGPAAALAALVAGVVLVVVLVPGGSGHRRALEANGSAASSAAASSSATTSAGSSPAGPSAGSSAAGPSVGAAAAPRTPAAAPHGPAVRVPGRAPAPRTGPRRDVTQSARLALAARAGQIDGVAQQIYDVVGAERGIVVSSHVVSRSSAPSTASFALRVPSGRLAQTLDRLSRLRGAQVLSREDASADVTGSVDATAQRLGAARALRRSLLRRLAAATTSTAASQLQAALRSNAAAIARDGAALGRLRGRVSDSALAVSVHAPAAHRLASHRRSGGGPTLRHAWHVARRVLVVVLTVVLVMLAVMVPLGVLAAAGAWGWSAGRRRRREGALGS